MLKFSNNSLFLFFLSKKGSCSFRAQIKIPKEILAMSSNSNSTAITINSESPRHRPKKSLNQLINNRKAFFQSKSQPLLKIFSINNDYMSNYPNEPNNNNLNVSNYDISAISTNNLSFMLNNNNNNSNNNSNENLTIDNVVDNDYSISIVAKWDDSEQCPLIITKSYIDKRPAIYSPKRSLDDDIDDEIEKENEEMALKNSFGAKEDKSKFGNIVVWKTFIFFFNLFFIRINAEIELIFFWQILNFFPVSSNVYRGYWDVTTDGDKILQNSVIWVSEKSIKLRKEMHIKQEVEKERKKNWELLEDILI